MTGTMRSNDQQQHYLLYASEQTLEFPSERRSILATEGPSVPLSIFSGKLSTLQALVKYLHEMRLLSFSEIGSLLGRSQKTIWATYAVIKGERLSFSEGGLTIPLSRFSSRLLSPLETLVSFLDELDFANVEIARALSLDPRTTWTVKQRAKKKGVMRR